MHARLLPEWPSPTDVTPTQILAAAVIEMAIRDAATNRTGAASARHFLDGHGGALHFWCTIAGLDPAHVRAAWQQVSRAPDAAARVHSGRSLVERVTAGP